MQSRGCEDRSHVTLGQLEDAEAGHENCVYFTPATSRELFYRNEGCRPVSPETGDPLRPANFQALCLVVLIEAESQKALLEEMLSSGRVLTDPVRFNFSYATTTAASPNFDVASVGAALSVLAQDQYAADQVGQRAFDDLAAAEDDYELKKTQLELYTNTLNGVSVSLTGQVFGDGYSLQDMIDYKDNPLEPALDAAEAKLEQLREEYDLSCTPSETVTCGRSSIAAPNPWVADDGTPCRGYSTFEVDPGAVCARWGSPNNVDAATPDEAHELLTDDPPTCLSESGDLLKCSVKAESGIRAGSYELEEMARLDRRFYCQSPLIKELYLERPDVLESECREELTQRKNYCQEETCPPCVAQCTSALAQSIAGVVKCTITRDQMGFTWSLETSDQGQLAKSLHGADRGDAYIAVPERLAADAFHRFHHNPDGLLQRDAVSCRMDHQTSTMGHFTKGFSEKDGNPLARTGYHVSCVKDSDCYQKCPQHPLTGSYYRCAKGGSFKYFDSPVTSDSDDFMEAGVEYVNLTDGSSSSFDVAAGSGVCVDAVPAMNQGCPIETFAKVVDGLVGCPDTWVSMFLCGLEVRVKHGDVSTAAVEGNPIYPRELYAGFYCYDPVDCVDKCQYLSRTSVNGMGTPPTCALCDRTPPPAPSQPASFTHAVLVACCRILLIQHHHDRHDPRGRGLP